MQRLDKYLKGAMKSEMSLLHQQVLKSAEECSASILIEIKKKPRRNFSSEGQGV